MDVILIIALAALVVGVVVALALEDEICAQLRARHPDLWESLGSPDRFFDDGGSMRYRALARLYRQPDLLSRCSVDILRLVRLTRMIGRVCLVIAGVALAGCLAHFLGWL